MPRDCISHCYVYMNVKFEFNEVIYCRTYRYNISAEN